MRGPMHNPFRQPELPLQLTLEAPPATLDILELRLEEVALALTRPVNPATPHLTALVDDKTLPEIERIAEAVGGGSIRIHAEKLAAIDWVTQVQKDFPAFRLGQFYVYASHAAEPLPLNLHPLRIDAVAAFGTGEHDTTAGCLLALAAIAQRDAHVVRVLDMGCGTAILGIGAARLWKAARITACDNDPVAVRVSAHNVAVNRVAARTRTWVSDGYRHLPIRRLPKQQVVVANILAKPLMRMARDAAHMLAPGGTLILSGLLHSQENMVLAAHRAQGLRLRYRLRRGKWSILVLQ